MMTWRIAVAIFGFLAVLFAIEYAIHRRGWWSLTEPTLDPDDDLEINPRHVAQRESGTEAITAKAEPDATDQDAGSSPAVPRLAFDVVDRDGHIVLGTHEFLEAEIARGVAWVHCEPPTKPAQEEHMQAVNVVLVDRAGQLVEQRLIQIEAGVECPLVMIVGAGANERVYVLEDSRWAPSPRYREPAAVERLDQTHPEHECG